MNHPVTMTPINQLFDCAKGASDTLVVGVRDTPHPRVPQVDPVFQPTRGNFSDFRAWMTLSSPADWLYIAGPTGCGKSSLIRNIAAKLNVPLWEVTGHDQLDVADLLSQRVLLGGDLLAQHGPLVQAYLEGGWFVLNEVDLIHPSRLVGLNEIGSTITLLDMGGERVTPHPDFRFIATGNSPGLGDSSGLYTGVKRMNAAFMDRFTVMRQYYPDEATESGLLEARFGHVPEVLRNGLIRVANMARERFAPLDEKGNQVAGDIEKTISTRGLVRWASMVEMFFPVAAIQQPVTYSLDRAIAFGAEPATRELLHSLVQRVFGDDERNPTGAP
mgnify:CR=1 FL=1